MHATSTNTSTLKNELNWATVRQITIYLNSHQKQETKYITNKNKEHDNPTSKKPVVWEPCRNPFKRKFLTLLFFTNFKNTM